LRTDNRRNRHQRETRAAAPHRPKLRALRSRFTRAHLPKPREGAGIFRAAAMCKKEISGTRDCVAVGTVSRQLLSAPETLNYREDTGNSPESAVSSAAGLQIPVRFRAVRENFPGTNNREFRHHEQGCRAPERAPPDHLRTRPISESENPWRIFRQISRAASSVES
jgi:hypothetical protein